MTKAEIEKMLYEDEMDWDAMTPEQQDAALNYWAQDPVTIEHTVDSLQLPAADIAATCRVLDAIKKDMEAKDPADWIATDKEELFDLLHWKERHDREKQRK